MGKAKGESEEEFFVNQPTVEVQKIYQEPEEAEVHDPNGYFQTTHPIESLQKEKVKVEPLLCKEKEQRYECIKSSKGVWLNPNESDREEQPPSYAMHKNTTN